MAKNSYVGIEGVAKKITKYYIGDENGKARKVTKAYIGDENGLARLFYTAHEHNWTREGQGTYIDDYTHSCQFKCSCGETKTITENHIESEPFMSYAPTCTQSGWMRIDCTVCYRPIGGYSIPATGHKWIDIQETGYGVRTICENCGIEYPYVNG